MIELTLAGLADGLGLGSHEHIAIVGGGAPLITDNLIENNQFGSGGGIAMFGILGIIIGPIIAALFSTVWQIYGDSFKEYLPAVGDALAELRTAPEPDPETDSTSEQESQRPPD